jgi:hypothetical protein
MNKTNYVGLDLSKPEVIADLAAEASPRAFARNSEPSGLAAGPLVNKATFSYSMSLVGPDGSESRP